MSFLENLKFDKLKFSLSKTRNKFINSINEAISGKAIIDDYTIDEIEEILISSDIGYKTTEKIINNVRLTLRTDKDRSPTNIINSVKNELEKIVCGSVEDNNLNKRTLNKTKPYVVLIIGVNGTGKTTTIGKLAYYYKNMGAKVLVVAADTFRAAAREQLDIWAERAGADLLKSDSSDPSSVAFDAVKKAIDQKYDVVLIDTAGRLHNKTNLMSELAKIKRAINKVLPEAPHETYLILDGTVGQNAMIQVDEFSKVTNITGLVITKLDGTAKGGVVFQICGSQNIPVKYLGIGESIDALQTFNSKLFIDAIFSN
jgi:fused signal recognition particle receptor